MYARLVDLLQQLHEDVEVDESHLELRARMDGQLLCRVVPYRELLHMQVGNSPAWEVRVRDQDGFEQAVDRVLRVMLGRIATAPPPARRPLR